MFWCVFRFWRYLRVIKQWKWLFTYILLKGLPNTWHFTLLINIKLINDNDYFRWFFLLLLKNALKCSEFLTKLFYLKYFLVSKFIVHWAAPLDQLYIDVSAHNLDNFKYHKKMYFLFHIFISGYKPCIFKKCLEIKKSGIFSVDYSRLPKFISL